MGQRVKKDVKRKLRRALVDHLRSLGFVKGVDGRLSPPDDEKATIRALHSSQLRDRLRSERLFIKEKWPELSVHFADGKDLSPEKMKPRLQLIDADTMESDLFRLASLTWRVPVSQGYGRRLRFLVWDDANDKLMGLFALGDPVFNLKVRDGWVGWDADDRRARLANLLDAYVLGAVPPYNMLLGGKLVACLIRSTNVWDSFRDKYGSAKGIISNERKNARLVAVTTSSSMGRSSLYNRLKLNGNWYFQPLGFTTGWGHFHVPTRLFDRMREFLAVSEDKYANNHRFGDGPNWRLRAIRRSLTLLGLNDQLLHHGIEREVFICQLASNAKEILCGTAKRPSCDGLLSVEEVGNLARNRWVIPRSKRDSSYLMWNKAELRALLCPQLKLPVNVLQIEQHALPISEVSSAQPLSPLKVDFVQDSCEPSV